jgi:retron-type reverse transcriptase
MATVQNVFDKMTSVESLFDSWRLFRSGKSGRRDVQEFERNLEKNIFQLHRDLVGKKYKHAAYTSFFIQDPKVRHIRKACVRDRLVHQAIYTALVRIFEPQLIHDLYSSRLGKGTHAGVNAVAHMARKVSKNNTKPCWALKCDVRKFYDSVDHESLINLLGKKVSDDAAMSLIKGVIESFHCEGTLGLGLPIGNLTSQVFTNIYLNELDQFIKHTLRIKHYARFADDFVLLSNRKRDLEAALPRIQNFLAEQLKLELHPHKISLRPLAQGIDFLGYVILPNHRVLRTTTKRRMLRKVSERHSGYFKGEVAGDSFNQTMQSYLGMLSHADTHELTQNLKNQFCWKELYGLKFFQC